MEAIFTFMAERWPFMAAILIAVTLTVFVCKWYYGRYIQTEKKADDNEKRINTLPCTKHEKEISRIRDYLLAKYPKAFGEYELKKSPRELSEEGRKLFSDIGGASFLEANGAKLLDMIAKENPKTPFDVEQLSFESLFNHLNDSMFNRIKRWVYYCPVRKLMVDGKEQNSEVTIYDVCFVLSIPLRDLYLDRHPELTMD